MNFHRNILQIDASRESDRIAAWIRRQVREVCRKSGVVVGVSGGVDSAVVLGLCVRAFGPHAVVGLLMPERESSPESERLGRAACEAFGIEPKVQDLTEALDGFACYSSRDEAVRRVCPEYNAAAGSRFKIGLPQDLLDADTLNVFTITVIQPDGTEERKTLSTREFLQITAASNFKQRARMSLAYYHAELRNYAVVGTANKNEHAQGFFVKYGDGGADMQPIAHLYKTQVYQLARHLGVPAEIVERTPTTDTYSAPCTQQEFFFRIPFDMMDLIWHGLEIGAPISDIAAVLELDETQVERVRDDLRRKRRTTDYLRMPPLILPPEAAPTNAFAEQPFVL